MAELLVNISSFFGDEIAVRWFFTLLHFLWQGAVVGGLFVVGTTLLRGSSARARYILSSAALLVLPVCVAATFRVVQVPPGLSSDDGMAAIEKDSSIAGVTIDAAASPNSSLASGELAHGPVESLSLPASLPTRDLTTEVSSVSSQSFSWSSAMRHAAPWITAAWAVGVACFLVRLCMALWGGQRLRAATIPVADKDLLALIAEQAGRIGLKYVPLVAWCERVAVPTVVGVLRPVVLLPLPLMTGLRPEDVAVVIRHELAHIRRHDLWMNLIQRVIESLLFFHPVVWLISRRLSTEREMCCDELVVSSGCEPLDYATALLRTAELCHTRRRPAAVAVAATGNQPTELERRIARLVRVDREPRLQLSRMGMTGLLLLLALLFAAPAISHVGAHDTSSEKDFVSDALVSDIVGGVADRSVSDTDVQIATDELTVASRRQMAIQVVGPGGAPIKGALVRQNYVHRVEDAERTEIANHKTRTDAQGTAVITLAGTPIDLRLWVSSQGMIPLHAMWASQFQTDGHRIPETFTFQMQPGTTIGGTVWDENGNPIEGVKVRVMDATASRFHYGTAKQPGVRPVPSLSLTSGENAVITDKLGHWELHSVPPDSLLIAEPQEPTPFFGQDGVRSPPLKLKLRLSHPDYVDDEDWGQMQSRQNVTLASLRDQTAIIVMNRDVAKHSNEDDDEKVTPATKAQPKRRSANGYRAAEVQATADLDGTWRVVRRTLNGVDDRMFEQFDYYYWMFNSSNRTTATRYKTKTEVKEVPPNFNQRFIVNPATRPKQLTMYGNNLLLQCIYEQNADKLKVAYFGRAETSRPSSFEVNQNNLRIGGLSVYYFEKVDAADLPEELR